MPGSLPEIQHYYINLDRSPDRRAHVEKQLKQHKLSATRITGIDGARLGDDVDGIDPALYRRCHGREIRAGEIGCYLSHLKALQTFLDGGGRYGVILEDDAVLRPGYGDVLAALVENDMAARWDMVKMQCRRRQKPLRLFPLIGETYLGVSAMRSTGATAYLVNRKAAQNMVDGLLPMQVPWDHAFDRALPLGIKVRAAFPYPVEFYDIDDNATTIETSRPVKAKGLDRALTLWWRARSETYRVMAAITALVSSRF